MFHDPFTHKKTSLFHHFSVTLSLSPSAKDSFHFSSQIQYYNNTGMCSNKSIPSMNKKRRRPKARKSRAKKPKFLSLRLQFPAQETGKDKCFTTEEMRHTGGISTELDAASAAVAAAAVNTCSAPATDSHQLNLFPLHPENQLQDRENHDQENVAYFFSAADGGATTLTGLLDDSTTTTAGSMSSHGTNNNSSRQEDLSPSSASLTYAYGGHECKDGAALVRNAMKSRERDSSEEKWVCYSEVVERKVKEEEVTSSAVDLRITEDRAGIQRLSLKLDYQEILNAWCDKGPLYVDAESSQIVPNMTDDFFSNDSCYNQGMGWGLWRVPEMVAGDIDDNGEMIMKNGEKLGQREASVLRYKEKRQNRLFSNKIRYQVRKLNAEKRPRLKVQVQVVISRKSIALHIKSFVIPLSLLLVLCINCSIILSC